MESGGLIHIVGSACRPEVEESFNHWYDTRHVPDLLSFDEVRGATRYRLMSSTEATRKPLAVAGDPTFLTIYEYENRKGYWDYRANPRRLAMVDDWNRQFAAAGGEVVWRVEYEVVKVWRK